MTPEIHDHIVSSPAIITHIAAGIIAMFSGAAALSVRKGERWHRVFGTIFFVSMLILTGLGAYLAVLVHQMNNVVGGVLGFYLVGTAWLTVRRKNGRIGIAEKGAFCVALGTSALFLLWGFEATASPNGQLYGYPAALYFAPACLAAFFAALDLNVILRGGISGRPRIARHVWRMCAALLGATASFFIGQQKVMPVWIRGSPLLFLPEIAILVPMIFWLIRVRFTNWYQQSRS